MTARAVCELRFEEGFSPPDALRSGICIFEFTLVRRHAGAIWTVDNSRAYTSE